MHSLQIELNERLKSLELLFGKFLQLEEKYNNISSKSEKETIKIELFRLQNRIKEEASVELFQIFAKNTDWLWICDQITSDLKGTNLAIQHIRKHYINKISLNDKS